MRNAKLTALCVLTVMLMLAPVLSHSEEELFNTKAAAQHTEKGIAHLKAKNYDAAIKEFEESSTIYPDAEAFYYMGYAYYMKGKINNDSESRKRSAENFDKAYELNPNFTPSRFKPEETTAAKPKDEKKAPQPKPQTETPKEPSNQTPEPPAQQSPQPSQ